MREHRQLLCAIDLGSSTFKVLIAEPTSEQSFRILGHGEKPSRGVVCGRVTNIEQAAKQISATVHEAEIMAEVQIGKMNMDLAVTGTHITSQPASGMLAISGEEVTHADTSRVLSIAMSEKIPPEEEIMDYIINDYIVDGMAGIESPIGMAGKKLEMKMNLVLAHSNVLVNLKRCLQQAGITPGRFYLSALAGTHAVSSEPEKKSGVAVIDIGSHALDILVMDKGEVQTFRTIEYGSNYIDSDLALMLKIDEEEARSLKQRYGVEAPADGLEKINLSQSTEGSNRVTRAEYRRIVAARLDEMIGEIRRFIPDPDALHAGVILCGDGAYLSGIAEYFAERLGISVQVRGQKIYTGALSDLVGAPRFSTLMGMMYMMLQRQHGERKLKGRRNMIYHILTPIKRMLQGI